MPATFGRTRIETARQQNRAGIVGAAHLASLSCMKNIRNFSIIAHIDHGKSTLADRLLQITDAVAKRDLQEQLLDSMDLERERGITIKSQSVRLLRDPDGQEYILNLIDTPGHVDFTYEVSRSLAACEGALLVIDATQGVEAQTIANVYLAMENNLVTDPGHQQDRPAQHRAGQVAGADGGLPGIRRARTPCRFRAKTGIGCRRVSSSDDRAHPAARRATPTRPAGADLRFLVRRLPGGDQPGQDDRRDAADRAGDQADGRTGDEYEVTELGALHPQARPLDRLTAGEVGYIIGGIKKSGRSRSGTPSPDPRSEPRGPLPGFKEPKPMVFAGFYPAVSDESRRPAGSLEKLHPQRCLAYFRAETLAGPGLRIPLRLSRLLHMEIVQERLERDYNLSIVTTAPSVRYRVTTTDGGGAGDRHLRPSFPAPQHVDMHRGTLHQGHRSSPPTTISAPS